MIYRYIFGCIIKIHQSEQTVLQLFSSLFLSQGLLSDNIYTRSGRYRNYGKSIISIQLIEFWRHYLVMLFNKYMWQINSSGNLLWKKKIPTKQQRQQQTANTITSWRNRTRLLSYFNPYKHLWPVYQRLCISRSPVLSFDPQIVNVHVSLDVLTMNTNY